METYQYIICYAMSCKEPFTAKSAAKHLGITVNSARLSLDRLEEKGAINKSAEKIKRARVSSGQFNSFVYWSNDKTINQFIKIKTDSTQDRVVELLSSGLGFSVGIVHRELGVTRGVARWALIKLEKAGKINKECEFQMLDLGNNVIRGELYFIGKNIPSRIHGQNMIKAVKERKAKKKDIAIAKKAGIDDIFKFAFQGLAL